MQLLKSIVNFIIRISNNVYLTLHKNMTSSTFHVQANMFNE